MTWEYLGAVGATTANDGDGGLSGMPVVVASGNTVAVAFNNGSTARIKVSTRRRRLVVR